MSCSLLSFPLPGPRGGTRNHIAPKICRLTHPRPVTLISWRVTCGDPADYITEETELKFQWARVPIWSRRIRNCDISVTHIAAAIVQDNARQEANRLETQSPGHKEDKRSVSSRYRLFCIVSNICHSDFFWNNEEKKKEEQKNKTEFPLYISEGVKIPKKFPMLVLVLVLVACACVLT